MSDNEINQGVKEGKTAGIAISSSDESIQVGFLMKKETSIIQIKVDGVETVEIEIKSEALLAVSRIITETLE